MVNHVIFTLYHKYIKSANYDKKNNSYRKKKIKEIYLFTNHLIDFQ